MRRSGLLALLMLSCSAQRGAPSASGTPVTSAPLAAPSTSGSAAPAAIATMDLSEFTPLLATPPLKAAAKHVEAGRHRAAAREVQKAMAKAAPTNADVQQWQFLLARQRELAGDRKGALASYRLAMASAGVLKDYATLGAARMLVQSGQHREAIKLLPKVSLKLPIAREARMLAAEAARAAGEIETAITAWRELTSDQATTLTWYRLAMRLAETLLESAAKEKSSAVATKQRIEALLLSRRARIISAGKHERREAARKLETKALSLLPKSDRRRLARPTPDLELLRVEGLLKAGLDQAGADAAEALLSEMDRAERYGEIGCQLGVLRAKALASQKARGKAADALAEIIRLCKEPDLRARALYLGGKYAALDGRHTQAVQRYALLEKDYPTHRLADDARLNAAFSYWKLGVEARFTRLLSSMAEDYPDGDMVLDGVFRLAMRRIEKRDWSGAASVLDRAASVASPRDERRGKEFAGRERYYRARAWIETGERERGLAEYERIVRELPMAYYMLHAYSRLHAADSERAKRARAAAVDASKKKPFAFRKTAEFSSGAFKRALSLLAVGEVDMAKAEFAALGSIKRGAAPDLLWGVALLYAKSGSAKLSHSVARGLLTDWLSRWPAGDWKQAWELSYPRPYHALVSRQAKASGVAESLVYGVMREESAFDPKAHSPADAYGLMQLIVPTAKLYARGLPYSPGALKQPRINITLGCRALSKLENRFERHPLLAIPGYNAGPGRPARWLRQRPNSDFDLWVELIPYRETRRYTKRVLSSRAAYAVLYDEAGAEAALRLPIKLVR